MNNTSLYTAQSALAQLPRQDSWLWKQAKRASSGSGTDPEARGPVWNTASTWGGPAGRGLGRGRSPGCGEWPPLPLSHCVTASEAWPHPRDCLSLPWPAWGLGGLGPFGLPQGTHRRIHNERMYWGSTERVLYQGRVVWQCLLHVWAFSKTEAQDTDMPFVHIAGFLLHRWGGFPDPDSKAALTPAGVRPQKQLHMGQELDWADNHAR